MAQQPEKVFRIGGISASVFLNEIQTDSGKKKVRNVTLQRRYRDGNEWKSASSFGLNDLANAVRVMQRAQDYVESREADVTT